MPTVADVVAALDRLYPPDLAEPWDAVGLVCGEPTAEVRRAYLCVDVVAATVEEALDRGADLVVAHHPLLFRPVSSVAATTYKGRLLHRLIRAGAALVVAHTNADAASPGVSDALASRLGLTALRPLRAGRDGTGPASTGIGRVGTLPAPETLRAFVERVASCLPATAAGVRTTGDPSRTIATVAVCGGAGDEFLGDATRAGVDAYLTADLRHHPASEHVESAVGPALVDVAHWASERPWLDQAASAVAAAIRPATVDVVVSDLVTDPWTWAAPAGPDRRRGEP
jgi:dinuclear metal center YbgI/SA1388 family protein